MAQLSFTNTCRFRSRSGWTLIELMVVIAIISILAAFSVPVMNMFGRNDLRDSARILSTLLKAARVYAVNHNVETAVVYFLDNPFSVSGDGTLEFSPLEDSITNRWVRTIVAATVMYRLPADMPVWPVHPDGMGEDTGVLIVGSAQAVNWNEAGTFVPAPGMGDIVSFPQGYSLLLNTPLEVYEYAQNATPEEQALNAFNRVLYQMDHDMAHPEYMVTQGDYLLQYNRLMERAGSEGTNPLLEEIGMRPVYVYPETPADQTYTIPDSEVSYVQPEFYPELIRPHMAHVFTPRGALKTRTQGAKERYRLMVAPLPSAYPEERVITDGNNNVTALGAFVEINRGTGYVRVRQ